MSKKYISRFDAIKISIPTVEFCLKKYNRADNDTCQYFEIECDTFEEAREQLYKKLKEAYTDCEIAINELKQKQKDILQLIQWNIDESEVKEWVND